MLCASTFPSVPARGGGWQMSALMGCVLLPCFCDGLSSSSAVLSGWRVSVRPVQAWTWPKVGTFGSEAGPWDQAVNPPPCVLACDEDPRNTHRANRAMAGVRLLLLAWLSYCSCLAVDFVLSLGQIGRKDSC